MITRKMTILSLLSPIVIALGSLILGFNNAILASNEVIEAFEAGDYLRVRSYMTRTADPSFKPHTDDYIFSIIAEGGAKDIENGPSEQFLINTLKAKIREGEALAKLAAALLDLQATYGNEALSQVSKVDKKDNKASSEDADVFKRKDTGFTTLKELAKSKDKHAMYWLGYYYKAGLDYQNEVNSLAWVIPKRLEKANSLLLSASEKRHREAEAMFYQMAGYKAEKTDNFWGCMSECTQYSKYVFKWVGGLSAVGTPVLAIITAAYSGDKQALSIATAIVSSSAAAFISGALWLNSMEGDADKMKQLKDLVPDTAQYIEAAALERQDFEKALQKMKQERDEVKKENQQVKKEMAEVKSVAERATPPPRRGRT